MSTQFTNRQWRLPNNENKAKQSNYSMDFDGSSQFISIFDGTAGAGPSSLKFTSTDSFSISCWINMASTSGQENIISFRGTPLIWLYRLSNSITFRVRGNGGSGFPIISALATNGAWHHVVAIRDYNGGSPQLKLYIDSVAATPVTDTSTGDFDTYDKFSIGNDNYSGGRYWFNGQIDAVSIYNYALSSSQVTTLYGSSSTGIGNPMTLNPVAYYPLGDQDAFNGADYLVPNSSLKDYVFDFDTSRIQVSNQSLGITSEIAISAWVKIPAGSTGGASPNIKQIVSEDTTSGASRNWSLSWRGGGYEDFLFSVFHSDGTSTSIYSNVGDINDGKWHHVVGTWDGTTNANAFKIYVDNVTTSTTSTKTDIRATSNIPTTIGAIPATFNRAFDGNISNVQIWDTNLSSTEIETLYNNGSPIQTLANIPQNSNLQGWWKLDASATYDSSTTTWTIPDDSSNSNDGTSSGMTQANLVQSDLSFTSGYSPYALDFDGTNDYINIPNSTDFNLGTSFTISGWFNVTSYVSNMGYISFDSGSTRGWFLFHQSTNLALYDGTSVTTLNSNLQPTNEWNSYIITYDGTDLIFYLNGQQNSTQAVSVNLQTNGNNGQIGNQQFASGRFYNGSISNVSVWDTNLSSSQVTEIYSEGVPSNLNNHSAYSNLVSWWQLGSNTSWVDPYWISLDEKGTNNGESQNVAAPNNMGENAIVDGVGSYANGLSSGMGGDEVIGSAPFSDANSLSVNMDVLDRVTDTPS